MSNALKLVENAALAGTQEGEFVTMRVAGQLFGIDVMSVQDVLRGLKVTRIPLAPKQVAGSLNLRGRIVTAIDVRKCLDLESYTGTPVPKERIMSVVVEYRNEFFSLIVDAIGEVLNLPLAQIEKSPANLTGRWRDVASGVYKMDGELLVILDISRLLKF
jgi:purine-binding chemotaxis protein CheW